MVAPVWNTNDVPTATDFNVWLTNVIAVVKPSLESVTSSTTLQDDNDLFLPGAINSTYWVEGLLITDGASGGDIKVAFQGPAGSSINIYFSGLTTSASLGSDDQVFLMEALG